MTNPHPSIVRRFAGDDRAIDTLIEAQVLAPGARTMTVEDIAHQHNGANAFESDDLRSIDPQRPLTEQLTSLMGGTEPVVPLVLQPSLRMRFVGGTTDLTVDDLADLVDAEDTIEDALRELDATTYWIDQNRLVEHGPHGYREVTVLHATSFSTQYENWKNQQL